MITEARREQNRHKQAAFRANHPGYYKVYQRDRYRNKHDVIPRTTDPFLLSEGCPMMLSCRWSGEAYKGEIC
jgi:hypothetical protein